MPHNGMPFLFLPRREGWKINLPSLMMQALREWLINKLNSGIEKS